MPTKNEHSETAVWNRAKAERLLADVSDDDTFDLADQLAAAIVEIDRLTADLEHATGPHCSSCGNAIDPDCCWCGTEAKHHRAEEHGFVPMGCDCSRDPRDTDWRKIASNLRRLVWTHAADRDAHAARCVELAHRVTELERLLAGNAIDLTGATGRSA